MLVMPKTYNATEHWNQYLVRAMAYCRNALFKTPAILYYNNILAIITKYNVWSAQKIMTVNVNRFWP